MRLWHYSILPYLPKAQLVSQWRECVAIAKSIHEKGTPNHILVNRIMNYPISEFNTYCNHVLVAMLERGYNVRGESIEKLEKYVGFVVDSGDTTPVYTDWHDIGYLKVCMANLWEKHHYAQGKGSITDEEWNVLATGYERMLGVRYSINGDVVKEDNKDYLNRPVVVSGVSAAVNPKPYSSIANFIREEKS